MKTCWNHVACGDTEYKTVVSETSLCCPEGPARTDTVLDGVQCVLTPGLFKSIKSVHISY